MVGFKYDVKDAYKWQNSVGCFNLNMPVCLLVPE